MTTPKRNATTRALWSSAVWENHYVRQVDDPDEPQLWAYTDQISYAPGDTIRLMVSTTVPRFDLMIERDGAQTTRVYEKSGISGAFQSAPDTCSEAGCGWSVTMEIPVDRTWASGGYLIRLEADVTRRFAGRGGRLSYDHIVLVRPSPTRHGEKKGRLLQVAATSTWIAYNEWGGSNAYEGITGPDRTAFSPRLSTQRPWSRGFARLPAGAPRVPLRVPPPMGAAPRYPHMEWAYATGHSKKYASAGWASYDRHFLRWAEAGSYPVDVVSLHDLHFTPEIMDDYDCAVFIGHDEYWSWQMRDAVDRFTERGGRAARFAGNFLWQVRLEDDGRTQVCYKYKAREADPLFGGPDQHLTTNAWEAAEVGRPGVSTFGLDATRGVYAGWGGCAPRHAGGFTVYRPEHWSFAGSDLYFGDVFGTASRVFGYEVDGLDYTIRDGLPFPADGQPVPDGLEIIALGLATVLEEDHGNFGADLFIGDDDARFRAVTMYGDDTPASMERARRGNGMIVNFPRGRGEVFHAGTCEWVAGLIDRDPYVEKITNNVLQRFLT